MDEGSGQQQKRDKDGWSEVPAETRRQREDRERGSGAQIWARLYKHDK